MLTCHIYEYNLTFFLPCKSYQMFCKKDTASREIDAQEPQPVLIKLVLCAEKRMWTG